MKFIPTLALISALAACTAAAPAPATHTIHERRHESGSKWAKRDRVHSRSMLPMRIGLTQRNLDKGHEYLMDV